VCGGLDVDVSHSRVRSVGLGRMYANSKTAILVRYTKRQRETHARTLTLRERARASERVSERARAIERQSPHAHAPAEAEGAEATQEKEIEKNTCR